MAGGVGAELTGGEFWKGATTGAIVAGLNHLANHGLGPKPKPSAFKQDSQGRTYYVDNTGRVHYVMKGDYISSIKDAALTPSTYIAFGYEIISKAGYLGTFVTLSYSVLDHNIKQWYSDYVQKDTKWVGSDGKEH